MAKRNNNNSDMTQNKFYIIAKILIILFIFAAISAFFLGIFLGDAKPQGNVARIFIDGTITADGRGSDVSSTDIVPLIKEANDNPDIKAILFEINSPGGSPVGSYEIADAIKKSNKTTVALIREVGASGAYWIASATDHIIANPLSITGSIGVYGSYLEFGGLLNRYNVSYERLVAGKYKDYGSPYKKLSNDERDKIQGEIDQVYDYFVNEVSNNRNISINHTLAIATGEVFLGIDALKLGLIDEIGSFDEAENYLRADLNIAQIRYSDYEVERGFFDELLGLSSSFAYNMGTGIGNSLKSENFLIRT